MTNRSSITTILVCLGLLACAGCGSDDGPAAPAPQETAPAFVLGESRYADWVDSEYFQPQGSVGDFSYSLFGHGNFEGNPVWIDLYFNAAGLLTGVEITAFLGADLVSINGVPMGPTLDQVTDAIGEPDSTRNVNGMHEASWTNALGSYSANYSFDEESGMTALRFYPLDR